jgi:hypothetical protein
MLIEQWNGTKWAVQAHPTITGAVSVTLLGAVATSATNAWAVGWYDNGSTGHSVAVQWNGASWVQKTVPAPSTHGDFLAAIGATSAGSAWAVGYYEDASQNLHTLIERWNGSTWSIQTSPDQGNSYNKLTSVTAISDTNVWAFGYAGNSTGPERNLALHWNGVKWSLATVPMKGTGDNELIGSDATAAKDVWAVGDAYYNSEQHTLALHKTSTGWHTVSMPNLTGGYEIVRGVAAVTATNAWAIAIHETSTAAKAHVMHWNGTSWATKSLPSPNSYGDNDRAILALSASDVWIVGNGTNGSHTQTLVIHYDGSKWTIQPSDNASTYDEALWAIAAVP